MVLVTRGHAEFPVLKKWVFGSSISWEKDHTTKSFVVSTKTFVLPNRGINEMLLLGFGLAYSARMLRALCGDAVRTSRSAALPHAHHPSNRFDQLSRVVTDAVFEDNLNVLNIFNFLGGVSLDNNQIGLLTGGQSTDSIGFP